MAKRYKGTLKCVRMHPILQAAFSTEGTGQPSSFGSVPVEFELDNPWSESLANFVEKICILKINGREIPKSYAWVDQIHDNCAYEFVLDGNMFVILNTSEVS